jgi:hypothetical protein
VIAKLALIVAEIVEAQFNTLQSDDAVLSGAL